MYLIRTWYTYILYPISIYIFPHQVITVPQHLPNSNCKALAQRDHDFWDLFTIDQSPQKIRGESDSNQAYHQSFGHSRRDKMRTFFQKTERQRIFFKSFVRYLGDFHKKNSISCKALRSFKGCKKKKLTNAVSEMFWTVLVLRDGAKEARSASR